MTDTFASQKRSAIMARIKSSGTSPELNAKYAIWGSGLRYAKTHKGLPGRPDIVLPRLKAVVFVNGCFWHGHNCEDGRHPKSNTAYWTAKIARNVKRDQRVVRAIRAAGWHCFHIRTCTFDRDLSRVIATLKKLRDCV